ncbi:TCR/Tet family MFS transporter [Novosphingopyxis sp.]|uniref:TCR/Tet family MFS transporter n=1 Tax=Novosphingopyxis sp. TaxID=2709690 RepID=UPI003B596572
MTRDASPSAPAKAARGASLVFVFLVVLIDMMGFGIIMPVLPALITDLTGGSIAEAAVDAGWLAFAYAGMQFLFGPVMGNLSDRFGRRPVLLACLGMYGIGYAMMGWAPTLAWLYAARIVTGVTGASFSVAYAYIADITPPERRAQNFGLIGMAFGVGFIFGPALGGILGEFGTRLPFFAASGLAAINFLFGLVMLKESLAQDKRRPFSLIRSNALSAMRALGGQNRVVLWYAAALVFFTTSGIVYPVIFAYYAIQAFGWTELTIGLSLALVGVGAALVQGGLIRIVVPRIGERRAVLIGFGAMLSANIIYCFATVPWLIFVAIPIGWFQGLIQPSVTGLMSRAVDDRRQGELQGATSSLNSLAAVVGPPLFTAAFFLFTQDSAPVYWPGAPYAVASVFALVSLALFWRGSGLHYAGEGADLPPDAETDADVA